MTARIVRSASRPVAVVRVRRLADQVIYHSELAAEGRLNLSVTRFCNHLWTIDAMNIARRFYGLPRLLTPMEMLVGKVARFFQ